MPAPPIIQPESLPSPGVCRRLCRELSAIAAPLEYAGHQIQVHSIHWSEKPADAGVRVHQHSYYEAILMISGRARETTGSRCLLRPGSLQVHAPSVSHGWLSGNTRTTRLGVSFSVLPEGPDGKKGDWPVLPEALPALAELLREVETKSAGWIERTRARLLLLLAPGLDLLAWPKERATESAVNAAWSLTDTVDWFLSDNLNKPLSLEDVATMAAVSVATLTRRYRRENGLSVMDRLNRIRMEHAIQLLSRTSQPVIDIAALVGFSDPSYFCRCFRRHTGQSPGCYRRTYSA